MKVESIIYIYGAVCVSMIVFNIIYNILLKQNESSLKKRCEKIGKQVDIQLNAIKDSGKIQEKHLSYMQHRLRRINNLIAFEKVLKDAINNGKEKEVNKYISQIQPVILYLAMLYSHRENMQAGYFTYFLANYAAKKQMPIDSLQDILLSYVKKDNLYCRINALSALYNIGNTEHIITAIRAQDDGVIYINEKILTEGLLSFTGNHNELITTLWKNLNSFSEHTKLAVLNYIRFKTGSYKEEMLSIMLDETAEKEVRLSAIRYFGKYYYEPALKYILNFVSNNEPSMWEYATVAVSALEKYSGDDVIKALKKAIHSPNWYIRYQAAQSLDAQHLNYNALFDIINGSDRYAREMMTYRLESGKLQKAGCGKQ